jgi:hypothetical protein
MSALGIVPHTGWAWVVRVGETVTRERIVALDVHDAELFHLARDRDGDRVRFVAERRAQALARTIAAMQPCCAGVSRAIVLGKRVALPAIAKIVASHAQIHGAEGELWRALFAEACTACGVPVERAATAGKPDARWLARIGKAVGPPWTAEVKAAAAAARFVLQRP